MIIPKKARLLVYSYLFKEGVIVVKKDPHAPKHHDIDVPNLYVMKLTQSFASRGYVQERFNWGWFYYYLTNEGIVYLREYLHLPEEIVPATLKKGRTAPRSGDRPEGGRPEGGRGGFRGERPESTRGGFDGSRRDKVPADAGFAPEFRGEGARGGSRGGRGGRGGFRGTDRPAGEGGFAPRGGRGRGGAASAPAAAAAPTAAKTDA